MKEYEFDAILDLLREESAGGTWLISLYIRPDKSIHSVQNRIVAEISEAESIKSDDTRKRVQNSLQKIRDSLSSYKQTPENGVAVFASPDEVTTIDNLPFECPENRYHCGKEFVLDPLESGFDASGAYGLIVVERGRASIGVLKGGRMINTFERESNVMGKSRAGGQSAQRFARERERQLHEFFSSVQEHASSTFSQHNLDGVVIGGTLSSAKDFSSEYVNHDWNIIGTYSVDHGDEQGLEELVERAESAILDSDEAQNREIVQGFLSALRDGETAYGADDVNTALERHAVDTLILSTSLDVSEIQDLSEMAENSGAEVRIVDPSFEKAKMFENLSNGYGALLRYSIH